MYEFLQFCLGRKIAKQQEISCLLKCKLPVLVSFDQLADLVSLKVKFTLDRYRFPVYVLMSVYVGNLCQSGQDTASVRFAESSFDIELLVKSHVHLIRVKRNIRQLKQPLITLFFFLFTQHVLPPEFLFFSSYFYAKIL